MKALGTLAVTGALLAWALSRVDRAGLEATLSGLRWPWLVAAALLGPVQVGLAALRWRRVSLTLELPLSARQAFGEQYLATLVNQLVPSGIAGEGLRIYRHGKRSQAMRAALHAAVVERFSGHLLLCGLCALLLIPLWGVAPTGMVPAVLGLVAVAALGLLAPAGLPAVGPFARDARRSLLRAEAWPIWGISALLLASFVGGLVLCLLALGLPLSTSLVGAMPMLLLAMSVPLSVGGWGLREATATLLLPALGLAQEAALALSITYGLSVLLGALPGALVPLLRAEPGAPA